MRNELDFISNVDVEKLNSFKNTTKDNLVIDMDSLQTVIDFSWVPMIERGLVYIDNIVRNPRRFIVPEEEIIIVEKTKKVNQETVKHLASHTAFIQDVDDDGMVKPSKLLNANKEETFDIYENRFIMTLLRRLQAFLGTFNENAKISGDHKQTNTYNYSAQTTLGKEKFSINVSLESFSQTKDYGESVDYPEMKKRIDNIQIILGGFFNSPFIKSIQQATPVHSPIHKTNLILKDTNFQEALKLWEFLDEYEGQLKVKTERTKETKQDDILKNQFLITYFLDYCALNKTDNPSLLDEKLMLLKRLINEYALESGISASQFKNNLNRIFENLRKEEKRTMLNIKKACNNFITSYNNRIDRALSNLK